MASSTPRFKSLPRLDGLFRMNVSFFERILGYNQVVIAPDRGFGCWIGGKTAVDQSDVPVLNVRVLDQALIRRAAVQGAQERVDVDAGDSGALRGQEAQVADRAVTEVEDLFAGDCFQRPTGRALRAVARRPAASRTWYSSRTNRRGRCA